MQIHCGVDPDFRPALKAHPAILVGDIDALSQRLEAAGHAVTWDDELEATRRLFTADPFGNRLEFIEGFADWA